VLSIPYVRLIEVLLLLCLSNELSPLERSISDIKDSVKMNGGTTRRTHGWECFCSKEVFDYKWWQFLMWGTIQKRYSWLGM